MQVDLTKNMTIRSECTLPFCIICCRCCRTGRTARYYRYWTSVSGWNDWAGLRCNVLFDGPLIHSYWCTSWSIMINNNALRWKKIFVLQNFVGKSFASVYYLIAEWICFRGNWYNTTPDLSSSSQLSGSSLSIFIASEVGLLTSEIKAWLQVGNVACWLSESI